MSDASPTPRCVLCGHAPLRRYAVAPVGRRAIHTAQWECPGCRLLCSYPQASPAVLDSYYGHDYYRQVWAAPEVVWQENLVAYRTELGLLDRFVPSQAEKRAALDVGCGYGVLVHLLGERGYAAMGCEMGRPAVAYCRSRGLRVTRAAAPDLPFADGSFQLVVSFHVIEHVLDPAAFIRALVRVLEPGGSIAIVTDHRWTSQYAWERFAARLRGRIPPFHTSTDHTYVFAPGHLAALLSAAGCHDIKTAAFSRVPPRERFHWRAYKGLFRTIDRWRGWGDYMMVVASKPAASSAARAA